MRLINTWTLELKEFFGDKIPPYAILSHTWGDEEVTFQQWIAWNERCYQRSGFMKIKGACAQARSDQLEWLWVDTNCIDKTSSAELSEAINSMYAWYHNAKVCYAYLADVPAKGQTLNETGLDSEQLELFRNSRWFTRGWTLQELLAPRRLKFFSNTWKILGDRNDRELAKAVSDVTGIEMCFLTAMDSLKIACVAQKMSWLSKRQTTRVEDLAYCMLGIFDINMSLLYGEGTKAFTRLQEKIIKTYDDHTIFCWEQDRENPCYGILARSPDVFANSNHYRRLDRALYSPTPYSITNIGLSIRLPLYPGINHTFAMLEAKFVTMNSDRPVLIPLEERSRGVLARSIFPEGPISLDIRDVDPTPLDVFVIHKPIFGASMVNQPLEIPFYGVLPIFNHSQQWFPDILAAEQRAGLSCEVVSHPPTAFDYRRDIITLTGTIHQAPSVRGALVLLLRHGRPVWYFYFAVDPERRRGSSHWYCAAKLSDPAAKPSPSDKVTLEKEFDRMSRDALKQGYWTGRAPSTDECPSLELGEHTYMCPEWEIRPVVVDKKRFRDLQYDNRGISGGRAVL